MYDLKFYPELPTNSDEENQDDESETDAIVDDSPEAPSSPDALIATKTI